MCLFRKQHNRTKQATIEQSRISLKNLAWEYVTNILVLTMFVLATALI